MKRNGFTLAELLGVIVILSLISVITIPAVTDQLNNYRKRLCEAQLAEIVSAAKTWATDNIYKLPTSNGETYSVTLETLSSYGYIDKDIQNPITKEKFDLEDTKVTITRSGKKYTYAIDEETANLCK